MGEHKEHILLYRVNEYLSPAAGALQDGGSNEGSARMALSPARGSAVIQRTIFLNTRALDYLQASMLAGFLCSALGTSGGAVVGGVNSRTSENALGGEPGAF